MSASNFVYVPVPASLYNEIVLRIGDPDRDISGYIEHAVASYLERTEDDGDWSAAYYAWKNGRKPAEEFRQRYGDPAKGYYWTPLFLPNGTQIAMLYGGKTQVAEVRNEKIFFEGEEISSPSVLASRIAAGTNRNAWRDLRIKRPQDVEYRLADELRRQGARA
jgi:hypothetical protein